MQPVIDPITSAIISGVVVAVVGGTIMGLIRRSWQNKDKKKEKEQEAIKKRIELLEDVQKSIWRLNKTVLIMAKIIDEQTEKSHEELNSSLESIATELLDDTKS